MHTLKKKGVCIFMSKNNKDKNNNKIKEQNKNMKMEISEDATKYGEWMSSFFEWVTPDKQKDRAEELNDMTKNREN